MRGPRFPHRALLYALPVIALAGALAPAAVAAEPVTYELHFERPNTHLLAITVRAGGLAGPAAEFAMPAWAPGAYTINEYAKMVQEFSASGTDGRPLAWRKTDEQTWRVELSGATAVIVRYKLYGNRLANTWVQYNDRHAHIPGPAAWMYLVGGKERPVQLNIQAPPGWRIATGLERAGEGAFAAPDYDTFADAPIEISDFAEKTFTVDGTTYHIVVHDLMGHNDFAPFSADTKKIVQTIVPMYAATTGGRRPAPFAEYWFLFHLWPGADGGLEHLNSTQINFTTEWSSTQPPKRWGNDYVTKLFVTAHEFYHAWNVKRLRPKPLGPFDYSRPVLTPSLWISEGLTSYYGELALVRAGLVRPEAYLDSIARLITGFEQEPGRRERSIEETSWDTWLRFSNSTTESNFSNVWYSYYDGGQIAGHLLDFAIRQATHNEKSLDDWMRLLYQRHALPNPGFDPEDAVRAASDVAGKDMSDFFRRYISGKEPLPYETYFTYAGIRVEKRVAPDRGWAGTGLVRNEDGRARIANIVPGSPGERAGLDRGDVIVAVDGRAVNHEEFFGAVGSRKPGETLKITVIHERELKEVPLTLGADPYLTYVLTPVENPTEMQKEIYRSWLGLR